MNFIVENEQLKIQYIPGNGAWTYQLIIPNNPLVLVCDEYLLKFVVNRSVCNAAYH